MNFPSFLTTLFENGCVQVPPAVPIGPEEVYDAQQVLIEFEVEYRLALANVPPAFELQIGCEAALSLYRVCQCLVYRDLDLQQVLPEPPSDNGAGNSAAAHYSTDVTLRFLPDAWRLARDASENDPLVSFLLKTAGRWPLSSVGIPGTSIGSIDGFADNPTLLALYVDRIIERRDQSRLDDPRVREAILRAIGAHDELAPELATISADSKNIVDKG
jgi:hypothetical protein